MLSYKAVHGNLIYRSQDYDNDSLSIVDNYLWDAMKLLLDFSIIYLVGVELCTFSYIRTNCWCSMSVSLFYLSSNVKPFLVCDCSQIYLGYNSKRL